MGPCTELHGGICNGVCMWNGKRCRPDRCSSYTEAECAAPKCMFKDGQCMRYQFFGTPVDCELSGWQKASECSVTCGFNGYMWEKISIVKKAQNGGRCAGEQRRKVKCVDMPNCEPKDRDCKGTWSVCDDQCT